MKKLLIATTCAMFAFIAHADENSVKQKVQQNFSNLNVEAVTYLKDIKLYELVIRNGQSTTQSYTNENVDFMFLSTGEIIDPKNKVNVTVQRELVKTKQIFNNLPFKEAFSVKYGKGTRKMAVFSDPDCPFCQEMEKDFVQNMKNQDVTVYYFMNPLKSLHPDAAARAAKILCDKDPAKAWVKYTTNGPGLNKNAYATWNPDAFLPKNAGTCSKAQLVEKQYNMASEFGFNSTPSIIFDNGLVVRDRLSVTQVMQVFEKMKP